MRSMVFSQPDAVAETESCQIVGVLGRRAWATGHRARPQLVAQSPKNKPEDPVEAKQDQVSSEPGESTTTQGTHGLLPPGSAERSRRARRRCALRGCVAQQTCGIAAQAKDGRLFAGKSDVDDPTAFTLGCCAPCCSPTMRMRRTRYVLTERRGPGP